MVIEELESVLAIPREEVLLASAKDGTGVPEILEAIVERVPPPKGDPDAPLQALIFDSHYDAYKGVIVYVRLAQGTLREHDTIRLMGSGAEAELRRDGLLPAPARAGATSCAPARWATSRPASRASARPRSATRSRPSPIPPRSRCPGYQPAKSLVFAGIYPIVGSDYPILRDAMEKLHLNDASFSFEPESSVALGFGFRCGFLGLLHMEIVQERLEREFGQELIASAPSVEYQVRADARAGDRGTVDNPSKMPDAGEIEEIQEPWVKLGIVTPSSYIGTLMELATNRRGTFLDMEYLDPQRVLLNFELPLAEVIVDFYDQLKTRTQGYASMDYEEIGYRAANLVKVDVLVAGDPVDALSVIVHRDRAQAIGRELVHRLRGLIPRQMFEIAVQAAIGSNVIARETVVAMRKNVLAKCYGGDITRKRKLLEKQKEGKQRMKRVGIRRDTAGSIPGGSPHGRGMNAEHAPDPHRRGLLHAAVAPAPRGRAVSARPNTTSPGRRRRGPLDATRLVRASGLALLAAIYYVHPAAARRPLPAGRRPTYDVVFFGALLALLGVAQAAAFALVPIRVPAAAAGRRPIRARRVNSIATAVIDEAAFRGALLGDAAGGRPAGRRGDPRGQRSSTSWRRGWRRPAATRTPLALALGMGLAFGWATLRHRRHRGGDRRPRRDLVRGLRLAPATPGRCRPRASSRKTWSAGRSARRLAGRPPAAQPGSRARSPATSSRLRRLSRFHHPRRPGAKPVRHSGGLMAWARSTSRTVTRPAGRRSR